MVPEIPRQEHLEPLDNKRNIKPTRYTGYASKNPIVNRSRNNSICYKYIDSKCSQYKKLIFSENYHRLERTG